MGLRGDLLAYALNQAECRALVVTDEWVPRVNAVAGEARNAPPRDRRRRGDHVGAARDAVRRSAVGGRGATLRSRRARGHVGLSVHLGYDRPVEGRRALAQRELSPGRLDRRGHGVRAGRGSVQRVSAVPHQRQVHDDPDRDDARPRHGRPARSLLGVELLGHLPRGGRHRDQLHGGAAADAVQAARTSGRPGQSRAQGLRGAGAAGDRARLRAALRRRAARGLRFDRGRHGHREPPRSPATRLMRPCRVGVRGRDPGRGWSAITAGDPGRDRGQAARAAHDHRGVLPDAGGDRGRVSRWLVPHRRPWRVRCRRLVHVPRPHEGRDPAARREHLVLGGRAGPQRSPGDRGDCGHRRSLRADRGRSACGGEAEGRSSISPPRPSSTTHRSGFPTLRFRATCGSCPSYPRTRSSASRSSFCASRASPPTPGTGSRSATSWRAEPPAAR